MYQRLSMSAPALAPDAQNEGNPVALDLIRDEEEDARQDRHGDHHGRRDRGFTPRRPHDLGGLLADLLEEGERVGSGCHHRRSYVSGTQTGGSRAALWKAGT